MNIKEAILSGQMCRDCCYYECCFYDRDCIAMEFLKEVAEIHDIIVHSNDTHNGDQ